MATFPLLRTALAAVALVLLGGQQAQAVPVVPAGGAVVLPGTTVAAQPELAGTILEDVVTPWESAIDPMYGFPGATGTLQSRVVRETGTGTLDFYWRISVAPPSYPAFVPDELTISGLVLGQFLTGASFDANYRLDGLGTTAPTGAVAASPASISYTFSGASFGPGSSSYFLLLHSNATTYASSATATLGETSVATFAPSPVPEPGSAALMLGGLAMSGAFVRRGMGRRQGPSAP